MLHRDYNYSIELETNLILFPFESIIVFTNVYQYCLDKFDPQIEESNENI